MVAIRSTIVIALCTALWAADGVALMLVGDNPVPDWLIYLPWVLLAAMPVYGALCGTLVSRSRVPFLGALLGGAFGTLGAAAAYFLTGLTAPPFYLVAGVVGGLLTETGVRMVAEM
jgi:hypothetical protein